MTRLALTLAGVITVALAAPLGPAYAAPEPALRVVPLAGVDAAYLIDPARELCFFRYKESITTVDCLRVPEARDPRPATTGAPAVTDTPTPGATSDATTGRVLFYATPWANLTLDGQPIGVTPKTLDLPAGPHKVTFTKGAVTRARTFTVRAGHTTSLRETME